MYAWPWGGGGGVDLQKRVIMAHICCGTATARLVSLTSALSPQALPAHPTVGPAYCQMAPRCNLIPGQKAAER